MGHDLERVTEHLRIETVRQDLRDRKSLGAQVDGQPGLMPTPPRRVGPVVQAQDAWPDRPLSMQGETTGPHLPPMTEQAQIDDVGIRHQWPKEGTQPCRKPNDVNIHQAPVCRGRRRARDGLRAPRAGPTDGFPASVPLTMQGAQGR
jgi:hypothetical protein